MGMIFAVIPWGRDRILRGMPRVYLTIFGTQIRCVVIVWPRLCSVAHNLLSITAASTSSERSFSVAGCTIEDRQCQLEWHSWRTDVPSQPSTLTVTVTVFNRKWTTLVIVQCSGLDECCLCVWKGFYQIRDMHNSHIIIHIFILLF